MLNSIDWAQLGSGLGILTGVVTIFSWTLNFFKKLKKNLAEAKQRVEESKDYGKRLVSQTTTAESRAAIYAYINFRSIEIESNNIQREMDLWFSIILTFVIMVFLRNFDFKDNPYSFFIYLVLLVEAISIPILVFYIRVIKKTDESWKNGIRESLEERIEKHLSKNKTNVL